MRKITGYIGAIIIVFALMGSILMGYALNVNGNTAIINDYEKVTDVSGLYTHSQEPSYIEYNPASNYIGYMEQPVTYNSDVGTHTFKDLDNATIHISNNTGIMTINGVSQGYIPPNYQMCFICDYYEIYWNPNTSRLDYIGYGGNFSPGASIDITITNGSNHFVAGGYDLTYNDLKHNICYWSSDDTYDYYSIEASGRGNTSPVYCYVNDVSEIYSNAHVSPSLSGIEAIITCGTGYTYYSGAGVNYPSGTFTSGKLANMYTYQMVHNGVYRVQCNFTPFATSNWDDSTNRTVTPYEIFYPKSATTYDDLGINYTESNRVNNYLMETTYTGGTTSVTTRTLNLSPGMGLTDYARAMDEGQVPRFWRVNSFAYDYNGTNTYIGMPTYTSQNTGGYTDNIRIYKLTDILNYYGITSNKPITVSCYGTTDYSLSNGEVIGDNNFVKMTGNWPYGNPGYLKNKWYCVYDPNTGIYDYYNSSNVKMQTRDDCYVSFCGNIPRYGPIINGSAQIVGYYDFGTRTTPYLNITYETEIGGTTTYHYADITKGFSIKDDNIANTVWDNEYSNGNIQILFRADYPTSNYHNDIIVGDNNISVDYSNGGYYITLNSGDPVNIGKWRNIVLDIGLRNGELTAIPVRTFNSFSNVVLDITNIKIGNLVNATPTNVIEWAPTSNSLMFNVYSTSVFMNTYGVVMVDPTLNITEYFTDLGNFYKLRLYNFSIIGASVTINGVNADVIGENITINDQTIRIKEMAITYVDNHVYLSDSNVNIDLGEITDNIVSMTGNWYFETELLKGFTKTKLIYNWDWEDFILNNTQFCIMYMGIALIALMIARHYCTLSLTDYIVLILSFAIALTVQVIA